MCRSVEATRTKDVGQGWINGRYLATVGVSSVIKTGFEVARYTSDNAQYLRNLYKLIQFHLLLIMFVFILSR